MKSYENLPNECGHTTHKAFSQEQKLRLGCIAGHYRDIMEKALDENRPHCDTANNSLATADLTDGLVIAIEEAFGSMFYLLQQEYCDFSRLRWIVVSSIVDRLNLSQKEIDELLKSEGDEN